ncbi:hypothetical protein AcW1_005508 [Taiwanofungus camphoratus]|nr:hypothetical protein AcW2_004276 [Antrodia cinnamomea]KAI0933769.1 hypothetical protein AcV5_005830 [Antrodia cinnamomea]KAI0948434.1 hypothetical protein AcV7_009180 [Antrodia cinnamomea]KAI0956958.1 hypothetical protein AcW1_005508 [Antrodia cinnamomea]
MRSRLKSLVTRDTLMSYHKYRKRRRIDAFPEDADTDQVTTAQLTDIAEVYGDTNDEIEVPFDGKRDKQQEIWDGFREENYEVLEQLPLSLHRSFTLMLELDQQVHSYESQLLQSLRRYIILRKTLENKARADGSLGHRVGDTDNTIPTTETNTSPGGAEASSADKAAISSVGTPTIQGTRSTSLQPALASADYINVSTSDSSRALLTQVAQTSEEVVRAANEKVNVARFAYDLVDRYIRDLDRAIKEQETSISLGLRPGTHPASIMLPEIVVPKGIRGSRITHSPVPMDEGRETGLAEVSELTFGIVSSEVSRESGRHVRPRRKGKKWTRKKGASNVADEKEETSGKGEVPAASSKSLKLTVPPLASVALNAGDIPIDPNEPRYCYCNQVSFGEVSRVTRWSRDFTRSPGSIDDRVR